MIEQFAGSNRLVHPLWTNEARRRWRRSPQGRDRRWTRALTDDDVRRRTGIRNDLSFDQP
jgi:hypothetical protein